MYVVQVLAETCNGHDGSVRNVAALGKDQVAESWSGLDDLLNPGVLKFPAISQIEDAQTVVGGLCRKAQESLVCDFGAVSQA